MEEAKFKVLLVDDEEISARMIKMVLQDVGRFEIEALTNPLEAMDRIRTFKPDIIILDLIMPEMSGAELGLKIKEDPIFKICPILFLTAAVSKENAQSWKSGVDGVTYRMQGDVLLNTPVLTKPVTPKELVAKIDEILAVK